MRISVVGYGTFITHGYWKDKKNVEVCLLNHFIRIYPKNSWFPFILPLKTSSFWALKFEVNEVELNGLDNYEGVKSELFERVEREIFLKNNKQIKAFIYIPTAKTINSLKLNIQMDLNDRWKEEIKKIPEVVMNFPELIL